MDVANGRSNRVGVRASAAPARYRNDTAVNAAETVLLDAKVAWIITKTALAATKESTKGSEAKYLEWTTKFPHQTREALLSYATSLANPGTEYFRNKFLDPSGDLYTAKRMADCCATVFNPLLLKDKSGDLQFVRDLLATELLPLFGFPEFTADFIHNFKDEIKAEFDRATHFDFDWDGIEKSRLFQTRLQKRRRDARNAADVDDDWKKDAGEKTTRIWEWRRPVITDEAEFPYFYLALKIIGTLQVSSLCS